MAVDKFTSLCMYLFVTDRISFVFSAWKDISTGAFSITMMDGGHFYLKDKPNTDQIIQRITDALDNSYPI